MLAQAEEDVFGGDEVGSLAEGPLILRWNQLAEPNALVDGSEGPGLWPMSPPLVLGLLVDLRGCFFCRDESSLDTCIGLVSGADVGGSV